MIVDSQSSQSTSTHYSQSQPTKRIKCFSIKNNKFIAPIYRFLRPSEKVNPLGKKINDEINQAIDDLMTAHPNRQHSKDDELMSHIKLIMREDNGFMQYYELQKQKIQKKMDEISNLGLRLIDNNQGKKDFIEHQIAKALLCISKIHINTTLTNFAPIFSCPDLKAHLNALKIIDPEKNPSESQNLNPKNPKPLQEDLTLEKVEQFLLNDLTQKFPESDIKKQLEEQVKEHLKEKIKNMKGTTLPPVGHGIYPFC